MPICIQKKCHTFEIFIQRPTDLLARVQSFSSYKHHKILIGITPQGCICDVSETWGGHKSEKFLKDNCGLLEHLLPGNIVMAERGSTITEGVGLMQTKLVISAFT